MRTLITYLPTYPLRSRRSIKSPQDYAIQFCLSFSSDSIVLHQVVFGLPLGLFPWGVHLRAILVILDTGILKTCPSHLKRLCCISLRTHVGFVNSSRFSFEIRFGQKILQICLSQLWWKLDSALISVFVTLQHSLPYSRTDFTLLLYNLIFVFRLYCLDFQMGRNLWNADLALASLFLMSFCVGSSVLTTVPRYVNLSTCWITVPSESSLKFDVVFSRISWVFF